MQFTIVLSGKIDNHKKENVSRQKEKKKKKRKKKKLTSKSKSKTSNQTKYSNQINEILTLTNYPSNRKFHPSTRPSSTQPYRTENEPCNETLLLIVSDITKAMIHFRSQSYDYMMYDQLLWETTDHDVTVEGLIR